MIYIWLKTNSSSLLIKIEFLLAVFFFKRLMFYVSLDHNIVEMVPTMIIFMFYKILQNTYLLDQGKFIDLFDLRHSGTRLYF